MVQKYKYKKHYTAVAIYMAMFTTLNDEPITDATILVAMLT